MDAVLEKMRMPRTTTTAVVMAEPTPSCVPRKTSRHATTTFQKKEVTKTRSAKRPSSHARPAPKSASRPATTATGRKGWVEQDTQDDSDDESDDGNHEVPPWVGSETGDAYWGTEGASASMVREETTLVDTVMPVTDCAAER